jgi:hypothetical protein
MATALRMTDVLNRLRSGNPDAESIAVLDHLSADEFIAGLGEAYPIVFLERRIGRKHEIGMARAVRFECIERKPSKSSFPLWQLVPVLCKCVFASAYDNVIGEITTAASLHVRPAWTASNEAMLRLGHCRKIDKTPDGWTVKSIKHQATTMSGDLLRKRGWKFEVLQPFLAKRRD